MKKVTGLTNAMKLKSQDHFRQKSSKPKTRGMFSYKTCNNLSQFATLSGKSVNLLAIIRIASTLMLIIFTDKTNSSEPKTREPKHDKTFRQTPG